MTVSALAQPYESRVPVEQEREAANQLRFYIAKSMSSESGEAHLRLAQATGDQEIRLPKDMSQTLLNLLGMMSRGEAVTLVPQSEMLSTQRAADALNVSRPYLIKLLEQGHIPFETVGRHRRIRARDLFAFKEERKDQRARALQELADLNDDFD